MTDILFTATTSFLTCLSFQSIFVPSSPVVSFNCIDSASMIYKVQSAGSVVDAASASTLVCVKEIVNRFD